MTTEYDGTVIDSQNLPNGKYVFKFQQVEGLDCGVDIKNTISTPFGSLMLGNSKRNMNDFIREIVDFEKKHCELYWYGYFIYLEKNIRTIKTKLDWLEKNNVKQFTILKNWHFFGLSVAPKIKYCLTIDEYGITDD